MSFAARSFQGLGASIIAGGVTISDLKATPTTCNGSMTVNTNGSLSYNGNASGGQPRWSTDTGTPGNSTWCRWTDTTGKAAVGGFLKNTIYPITSAILIRWGGPGTYIASGTGTLSFYADSGATQLLGSISLNIDVESS